MIASPPCPDLDQLRLYLHARLDDNDVAILEEHISWCDRCGDSLDNLASTDIIASAIRQHATDGAGSEPDEVAALTERLRCNPPHLIGSSPAFESTVSSDAPGAPGLDWLTQPTEEVFDFLAPAQSPDELGRLGPYRVLGLLGSGGMGIVFRAEDPHLQRAVALKAMKRSLTASDAARKRFLREARIVAAIEHDHIVTIHQAGEDRGVLYLAMPLLKGESLEDRLKREGRLPVVDALRIAREAALGLAAAHAQGLVHRDVKPANIWLEAARGRVKLLDFGLARAMDDTANLTQFGAIAGTPQYMSPEQARGGAITPRCDLFSLGSVLYQMLTGRPPFRGADAIATLMAVATDAPLAPSKIDPSLPRSVSDFVLRLLAKSPKDRPESALATAEAIAVLENDRAAPRPHRPRRPRTMLAAAAACLLAVAAIVITIKTSEGTLVLTVNEPDVSVVVDGSDHVTIKSPRDVIEVRLAPGQHSLVVSKDGFETVTREFKIVRTGKEEVSVRLEPRAVVREAPAKPLSRVVEAPSTPAVADESRLAAQDGTPGSRSARDGTDVVSHAPAVISTATGPIGFYDDEFPGLVPRPAVVPGIYRWQLGTRCLRTALGDLAWSPDGERIAACGLDEMVRVHDVKTMRLLQAWPVTRVERLDWSSDGRWIATGGSDSRVRLWRAGDGTLSSILEGHAGYIRSTVFSPDSGWLATADSERTLRVWNVSDGSARSILPHATSVLDVAWNPDGKTIATAGGDGLIRVWDASTGATTRILKAHSGEVRSIAFSADGTHLGSVGADRKIRIWDLKRAEGDRSWDEDAVAISLNRDASTAAIVVKDFPSHITLWSPVDGIWTLRSNLIGHWTRSNPHSARLRPDGERVASVNMNDTLAVWDVKTGAVIQAFDRQAPVYHAVACDAAGESIVCSGAFSDAAWLWRVADWKLQRVLKAPAAATGTIGGVALSPDGKEIAAGFVDRQWAPRKSYPAGVWNAGVNSGVRFLDGTSHGSNIMMTYSLDGRKLAAGTWLELCVWDQATRISRCHLNGETGAIAFRPDGRRIVAVGGQTIRFVDPETGAVGPVVAANAGESVRGVAYHKSDRRIVTAETTGVRIRDDATGAIVRDLPFFGALSVALSPDGMLLAASTWFGDIRVWEYSTGVLRWALRAHNASNRGLCFIPHSNLLVAGGGEGTLRFWDMRTGTQVRAILTLRDDRTVDIAPTGDLKFSDPAAEDDLVYLVQEKKGGPVKCLTPEEFRAGYVKPHPR